MPKPLRPRRDVEPADLALFDQERARIDEAVSAIVDHWRNPGICDMGHICVGPVIQREVESFVEEAGRAPTAIYLANLLEAALVELAELRLAKPAGPDHVRIHRDGQWWIAPLGTRVPPGRPDSPLWLPEKGV